MDNAIKSARSPIVRARHSRFGFVRGWLYEVEPHTFGVFGVRYRIGHDPGWDIESMPDWFAPANRAARRLLAPPVSPDVARYRRRVMRELRAEHKRLTEASDQMLRQDDRRLADYFAMQAEVIETAIAAVRRVKP